MGVIQKIFGMFSKYDKNKEKIEEEQDENIEDDNPYNFNISKSDAFYIANKNENLKTDYYRRRKGNITYIGFNDKSIKLVSLNNKKYWQIQILDGEVSGIDYDGKYETCWDGFFGKSDLKKLSCLIDVDTGEYSYYPVNRKNN